MDKPKPYIYHYYTREHDQMGVFFIGRTAIPNCVVSSILLLAQVVALIISGVVAAVTGINMFSFWGIILIPLGLLVLIEILVLLDDFRDWVQETIKEANERNKEEYDEPA